MAQLGIAWCKSPQWTAALVLLGAGQACSNEYPIQPTFCDDFCRVTLRSECDQEPEDCVRECELQDVAPDCEPLQRQLLDCYTDAPDDAFVCWSGNSSVRVRDGVCATQRDALLTCELPTIEPCLQFCRPYQLTLDQRLQSAPDGADAGVSDDCLLLRQPCETVCWNLLTIGAPEVNDEFGTGTPPSGIDAVSGGSDSGTMALTDIARALLPGCGF